MQRRGGASGTRAIPVVIFLALGSGLVAAERPVSGRVVDGNGMPVAAATLLVASNPGKLRESHADDAGRFAVTLAGNERLAVRAEGFACQSIDDLPADAELVVGLAPESIVRGRATDEGGRPLPGVLVEVERRSAGDEEKGPDPCFAVVRRTDADGRFELSGLAPMSYQLHFALAAHLPVNEALALLEREVRQLEVMLSPASSLAGTVRGGTGAPLPAARITVHPELDAAHPRVVGWTPQVVRTSDDGSFAFPEVRADFSVTLEVMHADHVADTRTLTTAPGGETLQLEVRLAAGCTLTGILVDENGEPVPAALVGLAEPGSGDAQGTEDVERPATPLERQAMERAARRYHGQAPEIVTWETDFDGRFDLTPAPTGEHEVVAWVGGGERRTGHRVRLEPGEGLRGERVRVVLGPALGGRVVDDQKRPVAAARVVATSSTHGWYATLLTDPAGGFRFYGAPGEVCQLRVTSRDHAPVTRQGVSTRETALEVALARTGSISGTARSASGEPLRVLSISLTATADAHPSSGVSERQVEADAGGAYVLDGLPPGVWNVTVRSTGLVAQTVADVTIAATARTSGVDVTLAPGESLSGQVVRQQDGSPIAGAEVRVAPGELGWPPAFRQVAPHTYTDRRGRFLLAGLAPGRVALRVGAPGFAEISIDGVEVAAGSEPVRFELGVGGAITGVVRDAKGQPRLDAEVGISRDLAPVDRDGRYRLEHVPPGTHRVYLSTPGHGPGGSLPVTVVEGETAVVDFIEQGTRLTGSVRRGGVIVPGVSIVLQGTSGATGPVARGGVSDWSGRFAIDGLVAGPYVAVLSEGGRRYGTDRLHLPIEVPEAPTHEHDFELPTVLLAGVVEDGDGKGVLDARLTLYSTSNGRRGAQLATVTTGPDGGFRTAVPASGDYLLRLSGGVRGLPSPPDLPIALPAGGRSDIVWRLKTGVTLRGRVLDRDSRPVPEAMVRVAGGSGSTRTDVIGRFALPVQPEAPVQLLVWAPGLAPGRTAPLVISGDEVTVRLTPGGSLEVVVAAAAAVWSNLTLELRDTSGEPPPELGLSFRALSDALRATGRGRLDHVPPGRYQIAVASGGHQASSTVVIVEGETASVELSFAD